MIGGKIMNRFAKAFTTAGILVASMLGATTAQAAPTITVDSTTPAGTYEVGAIINVTINFSQTVYVTGFPTITLETGPTDRTIFCNGNGSEFSASSLSCSYTVQVGDRSLDLDYQSTGAMLFNQSGQKIALSASGPAIDLVLPAPGATGSLSNSEALVINGSGEDEQWQSPAAAVAGLHSFVMQEDLRENVSRMWSADSTWQNYRLCSASIMNVTVSGGTATIKTAASVGFESGGNSGFAANDLVAISGLSNSILSGALNATHTVATVSGKTITFPFTGTVASTAVTSGTVSRDCSTGNVWYKAVLKSCVNQTDVDCIDGVFAQNGTSSETTGVFDQLYPARGAIDYQSPSTGIPSGGPSSLFTFSGSPHEEGNKYAVTVTLTGTKSSNGTVDPPSFFASVTPVSLHTTACDVRYNGDGDSYCMDSHMGGMAVDRDGGYRCILWDNTESNTDTDQRITNGDGNGDVSTCAKKHAFPNNTKFRVSVRLSQTPTGWFHGRMSNPEISLTSTGAVSLLSVKAGSVKVPTIGASGPYASFSPAVKDWFTQNCGSSQGSCGTRLGGQDWSNPFVRNAEVSPDPYSALSFSQLDLWQNFFDDSAGAVPSHWNVRTLSDSEMGSAGQCITNATGVTGVVTTNSTMYSQGPPTYASSTGTLDYKVAAPHFLNDGVTEFLGDYNLLVREDVAQCLYGFTGTDITSSVSVVDTNGAAKQATTSLTRENGFFKFSASGFTFSAPTIKAKLQGVQAAAAPVVAAPAVEIPAVTIPAVTIPAVTIPAVTVPAVTVPVVTVPVLTPKVGTPVVVASPPAAQVAAGLGMSAEKTVVRTTIKVPELVRGVGIKSYQVVLRSSTGKIVALQTIANPVAGKVMPTKLTAPLSGNYKVEIVATTTKGKKLPKWTSPPIKLKK
jgi:hypothetical protein